MRAAWAGVWSPSMSPTLAAAAPSHAASLSCPRRLRTGLGATPSEGSCQTGLAVRSFLNLKGSLRQPLPGAANGPELPRHVTNF